MNYTLIKGTKKGTIVFIHGNSSSSEVFNHIMGSDINFSKLAMDLPGHGQSMDGYINEVDFSMASYCQKIVALINHIDDDILIVGNSLGGHIAIEVSPKIPRLKGLVIFGAPPLKKPLNFEEAIVPVSDFQIYISETATDPEIETAAKLLVYNEKVVDSLIESYKKTNPKARTALALDFTENNWANQYDIFTTLKIPKFIIAGSHDTFIITEYLMETVHKSQGTCELISLEDCGHYPSLEKPEAFTQTIKQIADIVFI